jgi:hypothetical protein
VTTNVVVEMTLNVAFFVPNKTVVTTGAPLPRVSKCFPPIATVVPPLLVPFAGVTEIMIGFGVLYVKAVPLTAVPPDVDTVTVTGPAMFAGVLAVMDVVDVTETVPAPVAPKVTAWTTDALLPAVSKWEPIMVTGVRPVVGPDVGVTEETVGFGVV